LSYWQNRRRRNHRWRICCVNRRDDWHWCHNWRNRRDDWHWGHNWRDDRHWGHNWRDDRHWGCNWRNPECGQIPLKRGECYTGCIEALHHTRWRCNPKGRLNCFKLGDDLLLPGNLTVERCHNCGIDRRSGWRERRKIGLRFSQCRPRIIQALHHTRWRCGPKGSLDGIELGDDLLAAGNFGFV
jgi:hypothetical protein